MPTFGAVDVQYRDDRTATAAGVTYADQRFSVLTDCHVVEMRDVAVYVPGSFFQRELPAIRAVLAAAGMPILLIVDGYVDLDPDGRPGLGMHVHEAFGIPIIGVAKNPFRAATHAIAIRRGEAVKPLYVTSVGINRTDAADMVANMAGKYRMPDALRKVDALARGNA